MDGNGVLWLRRWFTRKCKTMKTTLWHRNENDVLLTKFPSLAGGGITDIYRYSMWRKCRVFVPFQFSWWWSHQVMQKACGSIVFCDFRPIWNFTNCRISEGFRYFALIYLAPTLAMMTSSNGNIFHVTGYLCWEFTGPRCIPRSKASDRSFDVFFDLRLNNRLSKQSWGWWFETLSRPLWRHCNATLINMYYWTPLSSVLHLNITPTSTHFASTNVLSLNRVLILRRPLLIKAFILKIFYSLGYRVGPVSPADQNVFVTNYACRCPRT